MKALHLLLRRIILRISRSLLEPLKDALLRITVIRILRDKVYAGHQAQYYTIPGEGFGLLLDIANPGHRMFLTKHREDHVVRFLKKYVRSDWVVFDVGAYVGFYTLLLAKLAKCVVAFEPIPALSVLITESCQLNGISNVIVETIAAGNAERFVEITVEKNATGFGQSSSIARRWVGSEHLIVPMKRLDTYVRENGIGQIDLLKIDVEGAEVEVLQGSLYILKQHQPILVIEFNDDFSYTQSIEYLSEIGYEAHIIGTMTSGFHIVAKPRRDAYD